MAPKRILLISLSVGAGHVRAAQALLMSAKLASAPETIEHIDMMNYVSPAVRKTIDHSYRLMMRRLPRVWQFIYNTTNQPRVARQFHDLMKPLERINCDKLYQHIRAFAPDHILCTHPFPANVIYQSQPDCIPSTQFSILLTDYGVHEFWLVPGATTYFVATEKMRGQLASRGINNVVVSGIPVQPVFLQTKDTLELRRRYGLGRTAKVCVVISGGQGLTHLDRIVKTMFTHPDPITIIAIAGDNRRLESRLRRLSPPPHITLLTLGWTDRIDEYLRMADVVISKPGGVTTTECALLGKPLLAIQPLPGQEEENTDYILEHGYGVIARSPADLLYYLSQATDDLAPGLQKFAPGLPSAKIIFERLAAGA